MILGEILGFVFYYISFGIVAKSFTDKFVLIFHKVLKTVFKIISAPFLLLFKVFSKIKSFFSEKIKKLRQKSNKNRKKHLQKLRLYVYNLLGIFCKQQNVKKKEGYNDEEKTS
jgi:cell shape-determining protein MreC